MTGRYYDDDDPGPDIDDMGPDFAEPGGGSALRAATRDNPRNLPCPSCHAPDVLTPADRAHGYQCDGCADACERGMDRGWVCDDPYFQPCAVCADMEHDLP